MGLLENVVVDYLLISEDVDKNINKEGLILEAKVQFEPIPNVKHHTYRIDKQLGVGGPGHQRHIHIFNRGEELFAMNIDGTAHDGYHQVKIPDDIAGFLSQKGFQLPPDNIIEFMQFPSGGKLLVESVSNVAMNEVAINVGTILHRAKNITIIEANVSTYQVRMHSRVVEKYRHVNKLSEVPTTRLSEIKQILISSLKETGRYCDDNIIILDDSFREHHLFVAWNENFE